MLTDIRFLRRDDAATLERVAEGVFDGPVDARWTRTFLQDARHHMFVAVADGVVVGMISAVDYVHPDKAPQLWINEVGVAPSHQRGGIGRRLLDAMLEHGRSLGCTEAWLGTEDTNVAARRLYERAGSDPEPFLLYSFPLTARAAGVADATRSASVDNASPNSHHGDAMADFQPQCPKCSTIMERGHVPDAAHGAVLESSWAPGAPEPRRFLGGIKYQADELMPMSAYRCPSCGYVEFYARPD